MTLTYYQLVRGNEVVADCVEFPNKKVAVCWRGETSSMVFHDNMENARKIHCFNESSQFKTAMMSCGDVNDPPDEYSEEEDPYVEYYNYVNI